MFREFSLDNKTGKAMADITRWVLYVLYASCKFSIIQICSHLRYRGTVAVVDR